MMSLQSLANLRHYYIDPALVINNSNLIVQKGDMSCLTFKNEYFDRVFCISVIEHLEKEVARKSIKEMARVLTSNGKLLITMDHSGEHVTPWCLNEGYQKVIDWSGLQLEGESDFTLPSLNEIHGTYHIIGLVLHK